MLQIKPSLHSAVIVISNGVYYFFKALTSYLMKKYCERWVNATIIYWNYGSGSIFHYWPLYFATFEYGALVAVIFFALNAIVEYCMFIITFQCLIEVVTCEWRWIRPWCLSFITLFFAILEIVLEKQYSLSYLLSENSFVFYMSLSSLAEILIIFWIYPLSRLLDDINFHFGIPPTRLRRWSFKLLPWFYLFKVYFMLDVFYLLAGTNTVFAAIHSSRNVPTCIGVLLALGAAYAFYEQVIRRKKGFCQLFKPVPEWGPKDYRLRQLRKRFNSLQYIVSQAPRDLSRHLIEKSGLVSYKLDVPYDYQRNSSRSEKKEETEKER